MQAVELHSGEVIGHVGLSPVAGGAEVGYAIAAAQQGQGYATEALNETLRWAFSELELPRVLGIVASDNRGSIRVLEKAGFTLVEETLRQLHGERRSVRVYHALPAQ